MFKKKYFVSYRVKNDQGYGFGNCIAEVGFFNKIDIDYIRKEIEGYKDNVNIIILSISKIWGETNEN